MSDDLDQIESIDKMIEIASKMRDELYHEWWEIECAKDEYDDNLRKLNTNEFKRDQDEKMLNEYKMYLRACPIAVGVLNLFGMLTVSLLPIPFSIIYAIIIIIISLLLLRDHEKIKEESTELKNNIELSYEEEEKLRDEIDKLRVICLSGRQNELDKSIKEYDEWFNKAHSAVDMLSKEMIDESINLVRTRKAE